MGTSAQQATQSPTFKPSPSKRNPRVSSGDVSNNVTLTAVSRPHLGSFRNRQQGRLSRFGSVRGPQEFERRRVLKPEQGQTRSGQMHHISGRVLEPADGFI